ncbi:MAG: polysaccharide biosynthesis protein, partial [Chloroflexi bacterium]|nr:polysaccharide biosynthesis protein [Chloroflexota bacterium]
WPLSCQALLSLTPRPGTLLGFLIRALENQLLGLFAEGKLNGTVHTCLGQEWTGIAVASALNDGDYVVSNHRGHGHYISFTQDIDGLMAELMGRESGVAHGFGGSQHLAKDGFFSNGILGGMVPISVGLAASHAYAGRSGIAVAFMGDGALGEGIVYESLNLASLRNAPLLLVVENNGYAQSTPQSQFLSGSIAGRATAFDVPIVGTTDDIAEVALSVAADIAILAIPSASLEQRRAIIERCLAIGLPFRVLPAVAQVLREEAMLGQVRDIEPEDLMVRPPAILDTELIDSVIRGKRVLVTGAAGSVGSELFKQIVAAQPELIIGVDHSENPLLMLDKTIRFQHPATPIVTIVADVADPAQLDPIFSQYEPAFVFHAAAYKHVAFMEDSHAQALRNNVAGTMNVARCAMAHGIQQFILVSTDKAVKPTSVMGATKRIAELLVRSFNDESSTAFTIVRFGNVLGSNGSVVPIFKEQIERGGPLTITDRDATRFFMSIPEAAGLILQATAMSTGGDIFQLDMGEPVKILELAETMITLSGYQPYEEIEIVFTGLKPGEKLHEELAEPYETFSSTIHPKLFASEAMLADTSFLERVQQLLSKLNGSETAMQTKQHIHQLLPEYSPASS